VIAEVFFVQGLSHPEHRDEWQAQEECEKGVFAFEF
jgi:hypothetical protein